MKGSLLKPVVGVVLIIFVIAGCVAPAAPGPPTAVPAMLTAVSPTAVPPTAILATPTAAPPTPAAVTADPLKVVAAFRAALAKHDVDKMVALLTEEAEWRHTEGQTILNFNGPDELRNFLGYYAVALDYKELRGACRATADKARIHCKVQARNIPYGSFVVTYDAAIAGDKISAMEFVEDLDAAAQARRDEFVSWARIAHPEEMARIDAEFGKSAFDQELGEAIAALHAEWQAARPTPVPVAAAVPDVVQKFRDALADRDIEAVIALFTDTGEWRHNGSITFKGRPELEPWLGYLLGLRYKEFEATCEGTPQPALTKCEARVSSALFGEYAATYHIEVTEGKINAILWQDNVGTEASARFDAFLKWLADTHPEENARIWEGLGNKSGYNQALGASINKAYEEWRATQQLGVDVSVRIMPLGDSITEGLCDTTATCNVPGIRRPVDPSNPAACDWSLNALNPKAVGYRAFLRDKLAAAGIKSSFVGSVEVVGELAHEGHSGWTIGDLDFCVENANWLEETQPDIILLHIGTNDMGWAHPPDQMLDDLRLLLEHIYAHGPKTHVIVAQVMAVTSNLRSFYVTLPELGNDTLAKYNAGIPAIVADFQKAGFNVSLVDMTEVIESDADFDWMGLHPMGEATERMADVWLEALTEILAQ
jgi:acyl-CoA thioesterase I